MLGYNTIYHNNTAVVCRAEKSDESADEVSPQRKAVRPAAYRPHSLVAGLVKLPRRELFLILRRVEAVEPSGHPDVRRDVLLNSDVPEAV